MITSRHLAITAVLGGRWRGRRGIVLSTRLNDVKPEMIPEARVVSTIDFYVR